MRPKLSEDQVRAASTRHARAFIEAGPGAGKTTVAAERFGIVGYCRSGPGRAGVVAVSFTIAATHELRQRIVSRWGPAAVSEPSRVRTIDGELVDILCLLLRRNLIRWPGQHLKIEPVDSWAGHPLWKFKRNPKWLSYVPRLVGRDVVSRLEGQGRRGFAKGDLDQLLALGMCTHEDVREIVWAALSDPDLRAAIVHHRRATVTHLLVDEVFDADELDLEFIKIHCEAEVPVTVVGDRWQALYEFRNAQPLLVEQVLVDLGFVRIEVLHSYRYKTDAALQLATSVRGDPTVTPAVAGDVDIVIAPWWSQLWEAPAWVLPVSFGPVRDQTDAMLAFLLDHTVRKHLDLPARSRQEALLTFGMDPALHDTWPEVFDALERKLTDTTEATATAVLQDLRRAARDLGMGRAVSPRRGDGEGMAVLRLRHFAARVLRGGGFVRGISAHQAKGKEWERVGVCLLNADVADLGNGLNIGNDRHRTLYVALTRGTRSTGRVIGDALS